MLGRIRHIKRRDFLKILGAATAGVALKDLDILWAVPDELVEEALRGPGIETFKNTVCQLCPAGCGIRVRLIDGVPVHIDGNPMHPINHGGICPHGAAGLDFLYHPDRIRQPLVRIGQRGSGQWKPVGWDEALATVAQRLTELRQAGTPEQVAFVVSEKRGLIYEMVSRFMEAFGSRNLLALGEDQNDVVPFELLCGWNALPEYDIENTQYLLSIGADFLDDGVSPLHEIRGYSRMRESTGGGRGRLTFVDSRHSLTAASADTYLPVKPGTHGAFALGVAYVVIKERYYDASFVRRHVDGFESWVDESGARHSGFRDYVLENYYPERVAQITGVPARKIVDVGRDFGRTRPAVAMIGRHGSSGTNGLFNALSVITLNLLIGNIEKKGGLRVQRATPHRSLQPTEPDEIARVGLEKPALFEKRSDRHPLYGDTALAFCDAVESADPYPIDTLFVYGTNPAFDHPYAKRMRRALGKIPFIVSFATMVDESSEYADVILPEHAYLERWMDSGSTPGVRFAQASVGQPVVKPFYDTKNAGDVLIDIAGGVGGGVARAFSEASFFEALENRLYGVFASGEGAVISGSFEESWIKFLKERGWQNLVYESFEDFWKVLVERGGWWDPVSEELPVEQVLETPRSKISLVLRQLMEEQRTAVGAKEAKDSKTRSENERLARWGIRETGDAAFLPHFEEPRFEGDENEYPYYLVVFGVLSNRRGSGSFSPLLQEMFGYYQRLYSATWVEINPHTAHRHHISQGDLVRISSDLGSISARAVFNEVLEPQTIAMPFGMGHTSGGRYAKGVGVNPYEILAEVSNNLWGKPAKMATRVKIHKPERIG
jgi:anaerobic selenocysteine-containing dehydrogenase